MTRHPRLRLVAASLAVVLGAAALGACTATKPPPPPPVPGECTQFWRGYVLATDHNYAGLGAFTGSDRYMCKDVPWQGVRAQIQHLRNYADAGSTPYNLGNPFEPRVKYDEAAFNSFPFKGAAPKWIDLNGKWAVPGTTYAHKIIGQICNPIRLKYGLFPDSIEQAGIIGPPINVETGQPMPQLTAAQIGEHVTTTLANTGNTWKPEITPTEMAQLFIDEGNAAGVRGDIAFCQSILETAWFAWPNSYGYSVESVDADYLELQQVEYRY